MKSKLMIRTDLNTVHVLFDSVIYSTVDYDELDDTTSTYIARKHGEPIATFRKDRFSEIEVIE